MHIDPLTQIDFYKTDHRRQYPKGTTLVYSNFTPRSTRHASMVGNDRRIIFFGLQYYIKWFLIECWQNEFFKKPLEEVISSYKRRMDTSLGEGAIPLDHIEALWRLGYLPIEILALPEGMAVDEKIPLFTIHNTHPHFFWLTNYLETSLSAMCWKMCTSATTAWNYHRMLKDAAYWTGGSMDFVKFQAHDFSFRGMGGLQDAAMSGAAHLTSFVGTDTIPAIEFLERYYYADATKELIGTSVPATEHSVMCMGSKDGEFSTFKRLITEVYPKGIVSIVSDSFDFWKVITEFLPKLKDEIMARSGGFPMDRVVIRPDSGDPVKIICGDPSAPEGSPERLGAVECLWRTFGGKVNKRGYRELDSHIGLIYGDSITLERASKIVEGLKRNSFASTNVVLGVGSYTYTHVTRDTLGFAMKATAGRVNGEDVSIFKDPKTDSGMKKSNRGFLKVICNYQTGRPIVYESDTIDTIRDSDNLMQVVFRNGVHIVKKSLSEIREMISRQ